MGRAEQQPDLPRAHAEGGCLVHIEPDSRELDPRLGPVAERLSPERVGILSKPVREDLRSASFRVSTLGGMYQVN